jgi:streptogramin lyase
VAGEVGKGFKSGGEGSLITVHTTPYLTPVNFTIGAWVRVDALSNDATMQIVWQGDSGNGDFTSTPYSLGVLGSGTPWVTYNGQATIIGTPGPGKIVATFSDGESELDVFSNSALTPGVFYYVALTWSGPSVGASIWVNGALDQTAAGSGIGLLTPVNPFQIGGIAGVPGSASFNGVLDELQIWGTPLTQAQISSIYNAGGQGECQNVWFTEFNGGGLNNIGSITPGGGNSISQFTPTTQPVFPYNLVAGSDGNVWFTESSTNKIGVFVSLGGGEGFGEYAIPPTFGSSVPSGITSGPDTNLWFTQSAADPNGTNYVGSISTNGTINLYAVPSLNSSPAGITAGPDGNLWFTEKGSGKIAQMTTAGAITEFSPTTAASGPAFITPGPDGNLWFTESSSNKIGVMNTAGVTVNEFTVPSNSSPFAIALGPDGNLWFTENGTINPGKIGRVTPSGTFTEFTIPTAGSGFPEFITAGPDGNLWYTDNNNGNIGRITPTGTITEFPIGGLGSVTPTAGHAGSGYQVGDILTVVQSGASGGTVRVTSIGGDGSVGALTVVSCGTGYSAASALSVTGGNGSGVVVDITGNVAPWGIALGP